MTLVGRYWSIRRTLAPLAFALLFCTAAKSDEMQLLWQIPPGERGYVGTGNTERGVAINPATGHVLLVSRTEGYRIVILDGQTGAELGMLNLGDGIIGPGTFPVSMIGVADDGVIYAGNLATPNYRLYRWESETAEAPTIAFEGDPAGTNDDGTSKNSQRWGDSIDVRGAGANTQVLLGSNAGTVAALFTTANGTEFTAKLISNAAASGATGIAFGAGNTFWSKKTGTALRQVSFNPATGAGTVLRNVASTIVPNSVVPIAVNVSSNWLAAVSINAGVDDVRLYDIEDPANLFVVDQENFPADEANGNAVGSADFNGDTMVALDTNSGLVAYRIVRSVTAPGFATQPASTTVLNGGYFTLGANVTGTRPIGFQWQFNGVDLANATNASLSFTNLTAAVGGGYTLVAANAAGASTSAVATVTVAPTVSSGILTPLWSIAPGSRPYVTTANLERGLSYNPANGHVLLMSRSGGNNIYVLDGQTGEELWKLQVPADVVAGGTFVLNTVAVADDGVVYAANLVTSGGAFAVYRWADDSSDSIPTVAFAGTPETTHRWGDTIDARGAGAATQLLLASNTSTDQPDNLAAVLTTADGSAFDAVVITTAGVNDQAFQLGIAFGEGNTFWGKAPNYPLQRVQFDLAAGTGTVLRTITNTPAISAPLGVSSNYLALVALENPDSVRLYELGGDGQELTLADQEILPSDNVNGNGTGAVTFGTNTLYALDTNNGIQAYRLGAGTTGAAAKLAASGVTGGSFAFTVTGTPNASYRIERTADFATWTEVKTVTAAASGQAQVSDTAGAGHAFYRAVAQ